MTGIPDEFIPDGRQVIDFHCAVCGDYTDYGIPGKQRWVCPKCGRKVE